MSNDKPPLSSAGAPSMSVSAESPLMTFLNSISGSSAGNTSSALSPHDVLDLSSILPASDAQLQGTANNGVSNMVTTLPLDADLDMIMRSLNDSVDVSKVSSDDIDKLLGSISVDFSSSGARPGASGSVSNIDPLASLSMDLGIDLSASMSLPSTSLSTVASEPMFTLNPSAVISNSGISAGDFSQQGFHVESMPASPRLSGINDHVVQRTGSLSSYGSAHECLNEGNNGQQSRSLPAQAQSQSLQQFQSFAARPPNAQVVRRPPPNSNQQLKGLHNRPQMPVQSGRPAPPRPSPSAVTSGAQQRPPRPANPAQATRPMIRTRPPYNGSPASHSQQGSPSPAGSPHPGSSPLLTKQSRPTQPALYQQDMHMQNQPRRPPPAPGSLPGANTRPQPRPQARPGPGTGATDPSKWLASTMGTLPTDQQERLAGLFRGLQTKSIDFQSFVRDAEAIMGPKFQDLLEIMRNQGGRPASQRPPDFGRPHATTGQMMNSSQQQTMMRPGHPMSVPATRPGIQQHSSPQGMMSSSASTEANRNMTLVRQLMAQNHQTAGGDPLNHLADILPSALSSALHQNGQQQQQAGYPVGSAIPAGSPFEAVITRWRQIILNPNIPGEQLAKLSMQLSAYGDLLVSPGGATANISEEAKGQQFAQISKLQALIAQRQFARGPVPSATQSESRPESPMFDSGSKDPNKNGMPGNSINDANSLANAKKRAADSRGSGSPAPYAPIKKQRTGDDGLSESEVEMQSARPALTGLSRPLGSMPGHAGVSGSIGGQSRGRDVAGTFATSDDSLAAPVARLGMGRTGTAGDASGSDSEMNRSYGSFSDRSRFASRELPRKTKDRRMKERAGSSAGPSGGSGDMPFVDDVIRYTGVDLREESEIILGDMVHQGSYQRTFASREDEGPLLSSRVIDGVLISHDRSLATHFANARVMEALVAKICKRAHIRAVSADAVPYLTLALQDRLRSFMELVSAAAYHRTRTQTLPPPPLNPESRLPLYKITPHLDVKRQLAVLERVDRMREQTRQQQLSEREQRNILDRQQQHDGEGEGGDHQRDPLAQPSETAREGIDDVAGGDQAGFGDSSDMLKSGAAAKRGRKKDETAVETAAYTSKNMPEDLRNKISNQTALRAAGGARKAWMTAGTASDWPSATSAARASSGSLGADGAPANRAPSARPPASTQDFGIAHGHKRNRSSLGTASDFESAAAASPAPDGSTPAPFGSLRPPPPLVSHRSTSLTTPLLVTVRDCLFSLERERLSNVRVGRGSGDRVLIQAYSKYVHD
ncbi:hypothetical protein GGI20_000126 [Coemansia sp. BCRC 34301]|nr:hypothetical protein GGI20_000126 [Coemansia sp. BCRC 34301]